MKKVTILGFILMATTQIIKAQNNSPIWPMSGPVGIGVGGLGSSPIKFNFHIHGTTDYVYVVPPQKLSVGNFPQGGIPINGVGFNINYGKTARIGLTNLVSGALESDGLVIMQSELTANITNQESGDLYLTSGSAQLFMNGTSGNSYFGGTSISNPAKLNVVGGATNGLFISASSTGKYGLGIRVANDTEDGLFIQTATGASATRNFMVKGSGEVRATAYSVFASNGTTKNFGVTQTGEVFARKYTTTLSAIPDYVFENDYHLMPLTELRIYLAKNKHLPNIPAAKVLEAQPVDLGEMNRLMLEKVEELTLYILQLEERVKQLEGK